jgi:hypothetical protein
MGRNKLASQLAISASVLDAWMAGEATMPDGKLLPLAAALAALAASRNPKLG